MFESAFPVPVSRAARLTAISLEAQEQSFAAIRHSLRLLRQSAYPDERSISQRDTPENLSVESDKGG